MVLPKPRAGALLSRVHPLTPRLRPISRSRSQVVLGNDYVMEEIEVDGEELDEARWFSRDEVAAMIAASEDMQAPLRMPPALSLAHQLARRWLDGEAEL